MSYFNKLILFTITLIFLNNCAFKKVDTRKVPINAQERARKNIEEGRGISINKVLGRAGKRGTNFEFSSSNSMWRASLEILDFIPMTTVDYSGGMIISDWYSDRNDSNESIKITVRFLANDVRSESIKIIVHKKTCTTNSNCKVLLLNNSKISQELTSTILRKAAVLEKESEKKK